jgi:sterol desaturase/sphingolipid hydroxylase (fatty acid hydroxylase superfamily)
MWASHVVHHSSEYYNLSTALRQTSTGSFLGWVFYLPLAVVGVPWQMLVIVGLIDLLYQYWVHTELIGRLGVLDRILVTPSNHRVHHGQNDYCIDKNYGGILVLWDRLFGTFADERDGEKFAMASASRCTASARSGAICTTTPTCGGCRVRPRAGAPSWVSGWRLRVAGPMHH